MPHPLRFASARIGSSALRCVTSCASSRAASVAISTSARSFGMVRSTLSAVAVRCVFLRACFESRTGCKLIHAKPSGGSPAAVTVAGCGATVSLRLLDASAMATCEAARVCRDGWRCLLPLWCRIPVTLRSGAPKGVRRALRVGSGAGDGRPQGRTVPCPGLGPLGWSWLSLVSFVSLVPTACGRVVRGTLRRAPTLAPVRLYKRLWRFLSLTRYPGSGVSLNRSTAPLIARGGLFVSTAQKKTPFRGFSGAVSSAAALARLRHLGPFGPSSSIEVPQCLFL